MADPRLGFRDNSGDITVVPTQYADGSAFTTSKFREGATLYFFDSNNFTPLPVGITSLAQIDSGLESTLTALLGSSGVIGDIQSVLNSLEVEEVDSVSLFDHFLGDTLETADWQTDVNGTGATASQPNNTGLSVLGLNTGTDDDGHATVSSDLSWLSSSEVLLVEARVRIDDIEEVAIEFGLSDAQVETGGLAFTSHDATPVAVADNAVVFGYLHDTAAGETNTNWSALSVNATIAAQEDTGVALAANTWFKLQLALALNGSEVDATWFIDGVQVATASDVVAADTPLYVWTTAKSLEAADAKLAEIDYMRSTLKY